LIIPALVLFDLIHWDEKQIAGLMAVVTFGAGFLATLFTRSQVVPTVTANAQIAEGIKSSSQTTVEEVIQKVEAK